MRLMIWIALGLLGLTVFIVAINTAGGRWGMRHWRYPRRGPLTYEKILDAVSAGGVATILDAPSQALHFMVESAFDGMLNYGSGFFVFSNFLFSVFTTFLLPFWTLSFATDAFGREREAGTLHWLLTRPMSRPALYAAKFLAALPWCLLLNVGGFAIICFTAGPPGRLAFQVYWPAVVLGTLAFASVFHFLGAWLRRAAIVALLYAFFIETVMGNLPGHLKRLSLSFYTRCLMFDRAHDFGVRPERPDFYLPVSGTTAAWILAGTTVAFLGIGMWWFARSEYVSEV